MEINILPTNPNFSWKKWGVKFAKAFIYVLLAGLAAEYGDNAFYLGILPLLVGLENYLKNK